MKQYLLIFPIEQIHKATTYPAWARLPLHCTLMTWFQFPGPQFTIPDIAMLKSNLVIDGKIEFASLGKAMFGPKGDAEAYVLRPNQALERLHTRVLIALARNRCEISEMKYVGAGYRPHVTSTANASFKTGSHFTPSQIVLIERNSLGDMCEVVRFNFRYDK